MIESELTVIRFRPGDVPELPELPPVEEPPEEHADTPEPEGWRPIGGEW